MNLALLEQVINIVFFGIMLIIAVSLIVDIIAEKLGLDGWEDL